ncbi:MAG: ATP-binding protein [Bacteroidales bacterium]|nr:ATP-binding protein [Bacteroidales bacterium]
MKSQKENVSSNLILLYRGFYAEAYLIDVVPRYDIHGKKVIENAVYKQLCFLGFDVKVGVLNAGEVDFVCTKPGKTVYVQASYIISEESTRQREFGPLEKIRDNHPKYVISVTPLLTQRDENGITHLSLRKFLKEGI